jgi:nucleoid-associated protein YgaU
MTSDAKIGLLLGLAFIFIIAFIINGLPSFREEVNNNELTTNMVSWQNKPPAIAAKEREIINRRVSAEKKPPKTAPLSTADEDVRFTTALPKSSQPVKKKIPNKIAIPKTYVVKEGDSLAAIAQRFYGRDEGNKKINIARIFEANRGLLKSPNEIYVGQILIIPPLSVSASPKNNIATVLSETEFVNVESVGARHLLTNSSKTEKSRLYTVREGDTLWEIAYEQLGDGSRYSEIAELNSDILDSEDNLCVGMRLKIPPQ